MKRTIIAILTVLVTATAVLAIPNLQLDIAGGGYDSGTETIVATSNVFTLYALLDASRSTLLDETYYISASITPNTGLSASKDASLGSFSFNGATVVATQNMVFGVPPIEIYQKYDHGDLSKHGIFPTYFAQFSFNFDKNSQIEQYNTQDRAKSGGVIPVSGNGLYNMAFNIDISNLTEGYGVHFDLYSEEYLRCGDIDVDQFAPYSHDAEGTRHSVPVPEPGTVILLGIGLLGYAVYGRHNTKKA